jgi:GNAT superfamily N-acetyltransferase
MFTADAHEWITFVYRAHMPELTSHDAEIRLELADPSDEVSILSAVGLGNRCRATIGLLPWAAYSEAARKGTLLLARQGDTLIAYALFGLSGARVRLAHLCVDEQHRRRGLARRLVTWISTHHADATGISARCRQDYGLDEMWLNLGFTQMWEAPGRSKAGHVLTNWWLDHGHPNLFTQAVSTVLVRASIDLNILRDLEDGSRPDAPEAQALVSDEISDRLALVRTPALDAEVSSMQGDLRGRCIRHAQGFNSVRGDDAAAAEARAVLLTAARRTVPDFPRGSQDDLDLQHVAESAAIGLNVFITRDEHLTELFRVPAEELYGLRILRPMDVIVHIDELVRAEAYRPASLLDTAFKRQLIGPGHDRQLRGLVNRLASERPRDFQRQMRALVASGHDRVGIFEPDGDLVAAYAVIVTPGVLQVPILRVAEGPRADTLARQLLFRLREEARAADASVIQITDPRLSQEAVLAAIDDGFYATGTTYSAFVLDVAAGAAEVEHHAVVAARAAALPAPAAMRVHMPSVVAAEIERRWWPVKVLDSKLLTYLIPIQRPFSLQLLGVPHGLFPRDAELGLSREHVYYRSSAGAAPSTPARLLWYMSGSGGREPYGAAVIACSQLDDVADGTPDELHSRFQHLGVWSIDQIRGATRNGTVQALRFSNTEVFPRPVALKRLRQLGELHGEHVVPQGPLRISSALFAALYREGRGNG